jgi:hypothetical protein
VDRRKECTDQQNQQIDFHVVLSAARFIPNDETAKRVPPIAMTLA